MPRQSKADRHADIHADALAEMDEIQIAVRDERLQCLQDRRFYSISGGQWEGAVGAQFENKPQFEFNKCHLALIRLYSEYRNNRITVDFQTPDGEQDDGLADACDGMFRADERACGADEAYDNCFEEGTGGGMGAIRLCDEYENPGDDEDTRQRTRIEPIFDADTTVFWPLDAKRYDKSDAKRVYLLTPYTPGAYRDEFGDDPTTWPKEIFQHEFDWCTPLVVWVCELYQVEETKQTLHFYRGLDESVDDMKVTDQQLEDDPDMLDELKAMGFREVRQKKVTRRRVRKYLLSGSKILEDCGYIAGEHLPVVPFYGKRWVVDGVERIMGHVRLAKDAQRLQNMLMSWLAEMSARFDIEKPIFDSAQVARHSEMWAQDNVKKFPYLLADALRNDDGSIAAAGPVAYTKAPNIPPAMAALAQIAGQALEDMLGNQQQGEEMQPNISGKAVELIQNRLDMQVFIYMSNFAKTMKHVGRVWLSKQKELQVEESRAKKTIDPTGKAGKVVLNQPTYDAETGKEVLKNDISSSNYEVDVDVGPSSSSKRSATVRALTGILGMIQDPPTAQAITMALLTNLDGEGLGDLNTWARRQALRMGVIKPTDDEKDELAQEQQAAAQQPPDPQTQLVQAAADQARSDADAAKAKTVDTLADAGLKRAQTAKTYAEAMSTHHAAANDRAMTLYDITQPPVQARSAQ
jgi:hypothetical protein